MTVSARGVAVSVRIPEPLGTAIRARSASEGFAPGNRRITEGESWHAGDVDSLAVTIPSLARRALLDAGRYVCFRGSAGASPSRVRPPPFGCAPLGLCSGQAGQARGQTLHPLRGGKGPRARAWGSDPG